jgi:hypothetical protein
MECSATAWGSVAQLFSFFLQTVQQEIVQSDIQLKADVQSKADKSPVTVADYGTFLSCNCLLRIVCIFCFDADL